VGFWGPGLRLPLEAAESLLLLLLLLASEGLDLLLLLLLLLGADLDLGWDVLVVGGLGFRDRSVPVAELLLALLRLGLGEIKGRSVGLPTTGRIWGGRRRRGLFLPGEEVALALGPLLRLEWRLGEGHGHEDGETS
jgi:hypothetical protein